MEYIFCWYHYLYLQVIARSPDDFSMFDEIVLLDDRLVAEGKSAGREDGKARGLKEGEGMGRGKGFRIAAEMGFYRGCCLTWLALNEENPGRCLDLSCFRR